MLPLVECASRSRRADAWKNTHTHTHTCTCSFTRHTYVPTLSAPAWLGCRCPPPSLSHSRLSVLSLSLHVHDRLAVAPPPVLAHAAEGWTALSHSVCPPARVYLSVCVCVCVCVSICRVESVALRDTPARGTPTALTSIGQRCRVRRKWVVRDVTNVVVYTKRDTLRLLSLSLSSLSPVVCRTPRAIMHSPVSSLDAAMRKARAQVGKRRIFLKSFFADFDHLHCGRITAAQFARVLTNNDVHLSPDEMRALSRGFAPTIMAGTAAAAAAASAAAAAAADGSSGYDGAEVLYEDFLAALDAGPGSTAAVRRSTASGALTPAEEAYLRPVSAMLRHAIQAHGTSLTAPFRDLDPLRSGRVTAAQFHRCLPFSASITATAMDLFAKQYSDGHGGVYYMAWCRAMDPALTDSCAADDDAAALAASARLRAIDEEQSHQWKTGTVSSLVCPDSFTNPHLSADELVVIFRQQCALYRLRYEDAFADYDKMKTGKVTAAQFESVLGRMPLVHFALRPENIDTLARAYMSSSSSSTVYGVTPSGAPCGPVVEYRAFLRDIHPVQSPLEITADGREVQVNYFASTHAADAYITSADDQRKAEALLSHLRALVQSNRICLSPVLRDFDRVRKGIYEHRTCTRTRFARGLATQNIMLPPEQLQLLIRKYTLPNPDGSPSSEVNYYLFVQDVDPSQAIGVSGGVGDHRSSALGLGVPAAAAAAALSAVAPASAAAATPTKETVLARVALQVVARRLHVAAFFPDADPLHSGTMAKSRLGTALGQAGLQLPPEDVTALQSAFASQRIRDGVDVQQLMVEVEAAVAALRASRAAEKDMGGPDGTAAAGAGQTAQVAGLLSRVRHNVRVHNALLMPFFADFDRHHRGVITPVQFAQACVRHHLPLTQPEMDTLASWYSAGDAVTPGMDGVRYLAFVRDVGCEEESVQYAITQHASTSWRSTPAGDDLSASDRAAIVAAADVDEVLTSVCVFLQERRPGLTDYFPDGDELRHRHVTKTRFRHCLTMMGLSDMTEAELCALEAAFTSAKVPGDVDYPAFVCTVRAMLANGAGAAAVSQRRLQGSVSPRGSAGGGGGGGGAHKAAADGGSSPATGATTAAQSFATATLHRIQRTLKARRTATIAAFREYDRSRKGYVTEGQFFACLQALGVPLKPDEAAALLQLYAVGNGQVHYLAFAHEVDDASLITVS
ncbi:hypothetical protein NESM_000308200 [Novymonas esmeraldas]|uniref:EF-hand domain-containing protein n=1 Tax=Novymonas esmeraldas TaxID=1808958 RepID=A0AAW0ELF1_9TRYP